MANLGKIYLPRHAGADLAMKAADTADLPAGHGETVLIFEDEASVLNLDWGR